MQLCFRQLGFKPASIIVGLFSVTVATSFLNRIRILSFSEVVVGLGVLPVMLVAKLMVFRITNPVCTALVRVTHSVFKIIFTHQGAARYLLRFPRPGLVHGAHCNFYVKISPQKRYNMITKASLTGKAK